MENVTFAKLFQNEMFVSILPILLIDRTTGKNIVWATDTYQKYGAYYHSDKQMFPNFCRNLILNGVLLPRIQKTKEQQKKRTKKKAEVFTPSWICNAMNNYTDEMWFGNKDIFNHENEYKTWTVTENSIPFKETKNKRREWQKYVDSRRIEITCGEAPYLVSRYDTVTGEVIPVKERIGILDRKLRVVNENAETEEEWLRWTTRACESVYGFEYQGDNLFFARVNVLLSVIERVWRRFGKEPEMSFVKKIAEIVSWNLWQMDGLKDTSPYGIPDDEFIQLSLFEEEKRPVYCKIKDWRSRQIFEYRDLKEKNKKMKFDYCIGNPPYQESDGGGTGDSAVPVYNKFVENAKKVTNKNLIMIIPSRWMKGGKGLESFRQEMMNDTSIKGIIDYENAGDCFGHDIHIDGGVCYFLMDKDYEGMCDFKHICADGYVDESIRYLKNDLINTIIRDSRQISIIEKTHTENVFSAIVSARNPYGFCADFFNVPSNYPDVETSDEQNEVYNVAIYGVKGIKGGARRTKTYIKKEDVLKNTGNIDKYKLFFSKAYSTNTTVPPEIIHGIPSEICTETFLEIGPFDTQDEMINVLSYLKTKFARALLFFNRHSLNISKESFALIPLQNFTSSSDIEWSKSIAEIDRQLYKKYNLGEEEIDFIESHVKEMT